MSRAHMRIAACAVAILAGLMVAALAGVSVAAARPLVRTAHNAGLNATILVDRNGHTLYHLSVEKQGRFICTDRACVSFWHPLVIAKGAKPTGSVPLRTVRRPDGRVQVTYKGGPLYTFAGDSKRGDTKGEGFKDVGIWHAAVAGLASPAKTPAPSGYGQYGG